MTTIYTKPQIDAMAVKIGGEIKAAKTAVTQSQGQSTTEAVSQKLFTDSLSAFGTAATKNVGTANGQVPLVERTFMASHQVGNASLPSSSTPVDITAVPLGSIHFIAGVGGQTGYPDGWGGLFQTIYTTLGIGNGTKRVQTAYTFSGAARLAFRGSTDQAWAEVYTNKNTTVGTNNEIIKSSPVLRVFKDGIEKIHEANDLDVVFIVNGVGDYTIKGTTGIRDGREDWKINIPKDDHDNQLIAFTMEEEGGIVHLKTYKRVFNMTTFMFEPDLSEPMDIPNGRWVDLHFKDIPQEQLDEPIE